MVPMFNFFILNTGFQNLFSNFLTHTFHRINVSFVLTKRFCDDSDFVQSGARAVCYSPNFTSRLSIMLLQIKQSGGFIKTVKKKYLIINIRLSREHHFRNSSQSWSYINTQSIKSHEFQLSLFCIGAIVSFAIHRTYFIQYINI